MLRIIGKSLEDNSSVEFPKTVSFELSAQLDSPTTLLSAKGSFLTFPPKLGQVEVWFGAQQLFVGKIDLQKNSIGENGIQVQIEARDRGRLLLDNEAKPETLWGANLSTVFMRHLGLFGFTLVNQLPPATLPVFTIRKTMSHWEVFSEFVSRAHGVSPFVVGDAVFVRQQELQDSQLIFGNLEKDAIPFSEFSHTAIPYRLISRFYLRDERGEYSAMVDNSLADYYGIQRERYVIPPSELLGNPQTDANQRIRHSVDRLEEYRLTAPQILSPRLGDTAEVRLGKLGDYRLVVRGYRISAVGDSSSTVVDFRGQK